MVQLSALILAHGRYTHTPPVTHEKYVVPKNIRLFFYDFKDIDYDNYYLYQTYSHHHPHLFFIHRTTGKIFKKELTAKEYPPGASFPLYAILSFHNMTHMMNMGSMIIHPHGYTQDFHNYGKRDPFIISTEELLDQLSTSYTRLFPDEIIEVHMSSHVHGTYETNSHKKTILYDTPSPFTPEEKESMEQKLRTDFLVVNEYPQATFIRQLARKKTPIRRILRETRHTFSKYRQHDANLRSYTKHHTRPHSTPSSL